MATPTISALCLQIERSIQDRNVGQAKAEITKYLKLLGHHKNQKSNNTSPQIFEAAEWLRRLGLFEEALSLVSPTKELKNTYKTDTHQGLALLWTIRLLNQMGAKEFSLDLAQKVIPVSGDDHRILGNIFLTQNEYETAFMHFEKMTKTPNPSQLGLLARADTLACMGRTQDAIEAVKKLEAQSKPSYFKTICNSALGEYYARANDLKPAQEYLQKALNEFPPGDKTPDHGIALKWMGYVQKSKSLFTQARELLIQPGYTPEIWLDLIRLEHSVGLAKPSDVKTLIHYPGLTRGFLKQLSAVPLPQTSTPNWISLASNEYQIKGSPYLGLPLELKLLAYVLQSGEYGIPFIRLQSLLWPDQPFALATLGKRCEQLVIRLRKIYGVTLIREKMWLRASSTTLKDWRVQDLDHALKVKWGWRNAPLQPPGFLSTQTKEFSSKQLREHYQISATQSQKVLREWMEKNWIVSQGIAPRLSYLIKV